MVDMPLNQIKQNQVNLTALVERLNSLDWELNSKILAINPRGYPHTGPLAKWE